MSDQRLTTEQMRAEVLAKFPDAVAMSNDYYGHWIGRKPLSEGFTEEVETLDDIPNHDLEAWGTGKKRLEKEAEAEAWRDAWEKHCASPKASEGGPAQDGAEKVSDEELQFYAVKGWSPLVQLMARELLQYRQQQSASATAPQEADTITIPVNSIKFMSSEYAAALRENGIELAEEADGVELPFLDDECLDEIARIEPIAENFEKRLLARLKGRERQLKSALAQLAQVKHDAEETKNKLIVETWRMNRMDAICDEVDRLVVNGVMDSRSKLADLSLNYRMPFSKEEVAVRLQTAEAETAALNSQVEELRMALEISCRDIMEVGGEKFSQRTPEAVISRTQELIAELEKGK